LLARAIRRCEAAAETAQVEPPTNDVAVRKDEFVEYFVACVDAAMSTNGRISAPLIEAIGQRLAEINDEWQQKIEKLKTRVAPWSRRQRPGRRDETDRRQTLEDFAGGLFRAGRCERRLTVAEARPAPLFERYLVETSS
jgi:hypothetical protein